MGYLKQTLDIFGLVLKIKKGHFVIKAKTKDHTNFYFFSLALDHRCSGVFNQDIFKTSL